MFSWIPPFRSGYERHIEQRHFAPGQYVVVAPTAAYHHPISAYSIPHRPLRPDIACTFSVMDHVCDPMANAGERHACRQGAVNAHTLGKGAYFRASTPNESSAFDRGFYSTFAGCPLQQ